MDKTINKFISAKNEIKKHFGLSEDFFISPFIDYKWSIKDNEGIYILTYWKDKKNIKECVVIKRDNAPIILEKNKHTMVVAIECVKIAFILSNKNRQYIK